LVLSPYLIRLYHKDNLVRKELFAYYFSLELTCIYCYSTRNRFYLAIIYYMPTLRSKRKNNSRWVLLYITAVCVLCVWVLWRRLWTSPIQWPGIFTIKQWDSPASIARTLGRLDATKFKMYLRSYPDSLKSLEVGTYQISGNVYVAQFVSLINKWPNTSYIRVTLLEGRSMYDMDAALAAKGYINTGSYIARATDLWYIQKQSEKYSFLQSAVIGQSVTRLEWFLYPDTYMIDVSKDFLDQLFTLQLRTFDQKIRDSYLREGTSSIRQRLSIDGFDQVQLNPYQLLILSTVIEKEERNADNKQTVAWIFINRLQQGMRLDADVTLCYGLHQPYEYCPPSFIAKGIYDASNPYNTRQVWWLTPTPIANPSYKSIDALINYKKTDNLFYLHSPRGKIYYGRTVSEHNDNKIKYLR